MVARLGVNTPCDTNSCSGFRPARPILRKRFCLAELVVLAKKVFEAAEVDTACYLIFQEVQLIMALEVVVMDEDDVVVAVVTIGLHSPLPFLCVAR